MDRDSPVYKELRGWFEFSKENMKSMITQIISLKELTASMTKVKSKDKKQYQRDIDKIVNSAIDKEIEYYITKHKIGSPDEYAKLIEKLSKEEIHKIKSKCCKEALEEMSSKNGS